MIGPRWEDEIVDLEWRNPGLHIDSAGGYCPFQADGTLHGYPFYFRFRSGNARLVVGTDPDSLWFMPLWSADDHFGADQLDLAEAALSPLLTRLISELRRAPIWWEFPGITDRDSGKIPAGTPDLFGGWGLTPEEAWTDLHRPSPLLIAYGINAEEQARMRAAQQIQPVTVTVDTRIFPDIDPFADGAPVTVFTSQTETGRDE